VTAKADVAATDTRYEKWIAAGNELQVQAASNGIAFLPDYKNWKSISSTDPVDNPLRVTLGNDIAITAITERHIKEVYEFK